MKMDDWPLNITLRSNPVTSVQCVIRDAAGKLRRQIPCDWTDDAHISTREGMGHVEVGDTMHYVVRYEDGATMTTQPITISAVI